MPAPALASGPAGLSHATADIEIAIAIAIAIAIQHVKNLQIRSCIHIPVIAIRNHPLSSRLYCNAPQEARSLRGTATRGAGRTCWEARIENAFRKGAVSIHSAPDRIDRQLRCAFVPVTVKTGHGFGTHSPQVRARVESRRRHAMVSWWPSLSTSDEWPGS